MTTYKNGSIKLNLDEILDFVIYATEAGYSYEKTKCPTLAKNAFAKADELRAILDEHKYFDK